MRFGWRRVLHDLGADLRPTLALAGPVVLAELGWMTMGLVDTMIVGPLGPEAIGAVSLGGMAFIAPIVFGMGLLLGLDTLVSQAFGAGDLDDARHSLSQGVWLAVGMTPPLMTLVGFGLAPALGWIGTDSRVLADSRTYLQGLNWGTLPLLIYVAYRRYLQAVGRAGVVTFALVSANAVNALAVWALVYGRLGLPAFGIQGAGWATTLSRVYMATFLVVAAVAHDRKTLRAAAGSAWRRWRPDPKRLRTLVGLGLPAAAQVTLEVGVFAAATALAGRLEPAALAAHEVVMNVSSVTFMIPLGLGSAGAVRVGHAIGRDDPAAAARAGWSTLALTAVFMAAAALVFVIFPRAILGGFTTDARVLALGVPLLFVAAGFQLFDGVQGVTTGNLRGLGDTRTPMLCHGLAHWAFGLPLGYALAFPLGFGVLGLWLGLSLGLALAGTVLLAAWVYRTRELGARALRISRQESAPAYE